MKDHVLTVLSNPTEGRENDYNEWYDQVHLSDVLKVEGVVGVRRYRLAGPQGEENGHRYLAIYELRTDDLGATLQAMAEADMTMSDAIDLAGVSQTAFEAITDRKTQ